MTSDGRFSGKVGIVTGGGNGIGAAVARSLAREGAAVAIVDVAREDGEKIAAELSAEGPRHGDRTRGDRGSRALPAQRRCERGHGRCVPCRCRPISPVRVLISYRPLMTHSSGEPVRGGPADNAVVTLVGSSWDHPRGHAPMAATALAYESVTAGAVHIDWVPRSLRDFGMASVEALARDFDLILIDHPHTGIMAESGCVLPIDELADRATLAALAERSPGRSHQSYGYDGHQWALAVDAACQTSAWRPDLLESPPASWDDVIALSRDGTVLWPLCDVDAAASLLTMTASAGRPCGTSSSAFVDRQAGRWALEVMGAVAATSDPRCTQMNPVHVLDTMSRCDDFVYAPLTFCYASYSRRGHSGRKLSFGEIPAAGTAPPAGALLGGAGLAVSALRPQTRAAVDYALFAASADIQRGLYLASGGQPAHRAAWTDRELDREAGGFFIEVSATLDRAWTRPRAPWFARFQNQMIGLFAGWRERASDIEDFLDDLDRLYREARSAAPSSG